MARRQQRLQVRRGELNLRPIRRFEARLAVEIRLTLRLPIHVIEQLVAHDRSLVQP
jgi:hypothetical protein